MQLLNHQKFQLFLKDITNLVNKMKNDKDISNNFKNNYKDVTNDWNLLEKECLNSKKYLKDFNYIINQKYDKLTFNFNIYSSIFEKSFNNLLNSFNIDKVITYDEIKNIINIYFSEKIYQFLPKSNNGTYKYAKILNIENVSDNTIEIFEKEKLNFIKNLYDFIENETLFLIIRN